jgi:mannose-1-phosphate guanylyltransferase
MIQSRPTDVDTATRTWTVIVAGSSGALGLALEQAASVSPPERTFVVVTARRPGGLQALPPGRAHVLVEPLDRGSAASILFPVHWIHARDPEATVVVFGDDGPGFRHQIAQAARLAERHAESLILLGLPPDVGEPERGFIVPGERIDSAVEGPLFRVRDLVDPDPDGEARPSAGALCNGGVFAGQAKVFIGAAAEHGAALNDRLARAATFAGQEHERWALRQAYALAPRVDFFRSVLRPIARALAVLEVEVFGRLANGGEERALGGRASLDFRAWSSGAALERR